ncbi:MAG: hypothetical protein H6619_03440 [Deltaproteobacteria bacterium]|nr:hypothetical protein [Deltaproteobacteria bacterium]
MISFKKATLIILGLFIIIAPASAATHKECDSYTCTDVNGEGPNQCSNNSECNTECHKDGVGTSTIYNGDKCGACTGGSCAGKSLGDECDMSSMFLTQGPTMLSSQKGTCKAAGSNNSSYCSSGSSYSGACGMQCLCKVGSTSARFELSAYISSY